MKNNQLKLNKITLSVLLSFSIMASTAHADGKETKESKKLATITVNGTRTADVRDQAGYDAIYESNYSSDYMGKKRINVYRGTNSADLLRNFNGVYSGEARNGGAIDPNIRGIQGLGRVPVTVDGSEQQMSVMRGYNGSSSRSYIDPMLISSIKIIKNGGFTDGMTKVGTGGGIAIRTIDARDVLNGKKGFGGEVRVESASNSAKFENVTNYNGWQLKNIPDKTCFSIECVYGKESQTTTGAKTLNPFGHDYAVRTALAYAGDKWSIMGAYAYRERGNYYAGKNHYQYYNSANIDNVFSPEYNYNISHALTSYFQPGSEILNTGNKQKSYLLKLQVQPTPSQAVELGIHRNESLFGEIVPSQQISNIETYHRLGLVGVADQIPLSSLNMNSYNLNYKLHPEGNKWLNLKAGLWRSDSSGVQSNSPGGLYKATFAGKIFTPDAVLRDISSFHFNDTRYGINLSNKFQLTPAINLTLYGSAEHRNYNASRVFFKDEPYDLAGRRDVTSLGFNFGFNPISKLNINIGAKYSDYHLHDDALQAEYTLSQGFTILNPITKPAESVNLAKAKVTADDFLYNNIPLKYKQLKKDFDDKYNASIKSISSDPSFNKQVTNFIKNGTSTDTIPLNFNGKIISHTMDDITRSLLQSLLLDPTINIGEQFLNLSTDVREEYYNQIYAQATHVIPEHTEYKELEFMPRADGKYYLADNPCLNTKNTTCAKGSKFKEKDDHNIKAIKTITLKPIPLKKGHGWTPSISIAYNFNDYSKIYARYDETIRYPDIFESVNIFGYDTSEHPFLIPASNKVLKPEHSHAFEVGYIHDLRQFFPNTELANIKIDYYQNRITNAIDRLGAFNFLNIDSKTVKGLELATRYDTGKFFTDLSMNYVLHNKVCDESIAIIHSLDKVDNLLLNPPPACVDNGFAWGNMNTYTIPKFATTLNIGTRLLNRKLELGSRVNFYTKYENKDYTNYLKRGTISIDRSSQGNVPYGWNNTLTFDAYIRYKINKNFTVELSGTNLTNQYYIDPASRSLMPAPGRVVKVSFTGNF